jgi:RNA polymerase subunit RPABC4/transcription elongation factor Spt4
MQSLVEMVHMSVKPLLCQNCGATVSLQENMCKCCGVKYAVETGRIVVNQLDMKKIGRSEKLMRNNLPEEVLEPLAPYPEERIIFEQDWKNLKRHFLVTNEKMIFYQEDMTDHWVLPFGDFGGLSIGEERNFMTKLSDVPFFVTLQLFDSKNNVWLKLPGFFPHGTGYSTLKNAIDNAYNLWLAKK